MIVELDDCEVALHGGQEEVRMKTNGYYRMVVCLDVEAESLLEAYGKTYEAMARAAYCRADIEWESSDEAFTPEGELIAESDLSVARMTYLNQREKAGLADHWTEGAYPVADWQYEVANGDTRLGYHEWCEHKKVEG